MLIYGVLPWIGIYWASLQCNEKQEIFFRLNKDVFATKSDKGGHTVAVDVNEIETVQCYRIQIMRNW